MQERRKDGAISCRGNGAGAPPVVCGSVSLSSSLGLAGGRFDRISSSTHRFSDYLFDRFRRSAGAIGVLRGALPPHRLVSTPSIDPSMARLGILRCVSFRTAFPEFSRFSAMAYSPPPCSARGGNGLITSISPLHLAQHPSSTDQVVYSSSIPSV